MSKRKSPPARRLGAIRGNRDPIVDREQSSHTNKYGKVKVSYLSEAGAKAAAQRVCEQHRRTAPDVYRCTTCALWHVGGIAPAGSST